MELPARRLFWLVTFIDLRQKECNSVPPNQYIICHPCLDVGHQDLWPLPWCYRFSRRWLSPESLGRVKRIRKGFEKGLLIISLSVVMRRIKDKQREAEKHVLTVLVDYQPLVAEYYRARFYCLVVEALFEDMFSTMDDNEDMLSPTENKITPVSEKVRSAEEGL